MALPVNGSTHLLPAYYSFYRPWKYERLCWPSWLTCSGWLTHISGHPSAAGRAQDRESSPARDRRSTTVPRHQRHWSGKKINNAAQDTDSVDLLPWWVRHTQYRMSCYCPAAFHSGSTHGKCHVVNKMWSSRPVTVSSAMWLSYNNKTSIIIGYTFFEPTFGLTAQKLPWNSFCL